MHNLYMVSTQNFQVKQRGGVILTYPCKLLYEIIKHAWHLRVFILENLCCPTLGPQKAILLMYITQNKPSLPYVASLVASHSKHICFGLLSLDIVHKAHSHGDVLRAVPLGDFPIPPFKCLLRKPLGRPGLWAVVLPTSCSGHHSSAGELEISAKCP